MTLQTFDGYNAASPTLVRSPMNGTCMWGMVPREFVTAYIDRNAEIRSGDFARLWVDYVDGVQALLKRLRVSRSGTWWLECSDGVAQLGALVRPFKIERVVALSTEEVISGPLRPVHAADVELARHFAMLAEDVVEEWRTLGHVDGVPFPGLNRVNYYLPDNTSTRNHDYRAPVAL